MTYKLSIHGYSVNRIFSYTDGDLHKEFTVPGGAALVAKILAGKGLADTVTMDDSYLREHMELVRTSGSGGTNFYVIESRSGVTPGVTRIDTAPAQGALLWGTDFEILPVSSGTPILWAVNTGLPDSGLIRAVADRCLLMVDANVLRAAGALISRRISWERTATELVWQLNNNPALSFLTRVSRLIVFFAEDGAVLVNRERNGFSASLVLTHGGEEGVLSFKLRGAVDDAFAVMTAALALQFDDVMNNGLVPVILPVLKAAESLMTTGYDLARLKDVDFDLPDNVLTEPDTAYDIPVYPGHSAVDPDGWCVPNSMEGKRLFDIAYDYVLEGAVAIEGLPRLSFGALTTVDRWEMESYQNIRNLIIGYAGGVDRRPLSIAVFGAPGSGKSFGVTQICENVMPGKVEKLEFNVSQLSSMDDLGAAFQRVRDVALGGKLPLVFLDEFDSDRDGLPLGWLKSFLMPMQDGKFKDGSGEHPLGRCVLVFAGGTSPSFDEFTKPMKSERWEERQSFKNIKGPDFISRLRGVINVMGPNQRDEHDNNYVLRRAILLRSLCERNPRLKIKSVSVAASISPDIIRAMLLVPIYKHGARSMEAIIDMSSIDGSVWKPVSLPFYSQLSLHVDADAFLKLVLRKEILNSYINLMARSIHEKYLERLRADGVTGHPNDVPWDELSEEFKESNVNQAHDITRKLSAVGFDYDAGDTPFPSVESFDEDIKLVMAQNEHIRWMNEKLANGWRYGTPRDDVKKKHPLILPWEELPIEEKQKDIDAVENIIPLLKSVGLRVYRTV
jgi:hypothetical protein